MASADWYELSKADPEWREASDDYIRDIPGESAMDALLRRIAAIEVMKQIDLKNERLTANV